MNSFADPTRFWQYKTDMTKLEKDEFGRHYDLAIRLALWWEDNAYFADIWPHWHEEFPFGEFEPTRNEWITRYHRRVAYRATARDGKIVPVRRMFMPKAVADAIVGASGVRQSRLAGGRFAYAYAPPIGYSNWETEQVRFLHLDIDYPYLKKLWKEQDRPDEVSVDPARHRIELDEEVARDYDRQLLQGMGALVVESFTGLHAHFYLLQPIPVAEGRELTVGLNGLLIGHVEQTNLGAFENWDGRQPHLPLPIPRHREQGEFMRVPKLLLDFFVEPDNWNAWKPVQIDAPKLWRKIDAARGRDGSGLQPSHHPRRGRG